MLPVDTRAIADPLNESLALSDNGDNEVGRTQLLVYSLARRKKSRMCSIMPHGYFCNALCPSQPDGAQHVP